MTRFGAYVTSDDVTVPFILSGSGPPTAGTHAVQEVYVDEDGELWVCITAGTPGTWWNPSGGKELAYAEVASGTQDVTALAGAPADITSLSITFDAPAGRPYMVEIHVPAIKAQVNAPVGWGLILADGSDVLIAQAPGNIVTLSVYTQATMRKRFTAATGSVTYKGRMYVGASDTVRLDALAGQAPYYIRAWVL